MKLNVRSVPILTAVVVGSAAMVLVADDTNSVQTNSLTIHEWGTFTSVAGVDGSAVDWDALGCKDDLPKFVNAEQYRGFKWRLDGTVRMETPVMYFYSPHEITARVKVFFPKGVITEWYPNGDNAIYESKALMDRMGASLEKLRSGSGADGRGAFLVQADSATAIAEDGKSKIYSDDTVYKTESLVQPYPPGLDPLLVRLSKSLNGIDTSLHQLMGAIAWSDIKVQPGTTPDYPVESDPSRYYAARGTDAAPITVGDQHEKFLFYRGVGRFQVPLSARVSNDGKVAVENRGADPVPAVFLFENRGGRLGYRNVGALASRNLDNAAVTLDRPSLDGSLSQLRYDLENALIAQGLFPKEAQAMVDTWRDSWFEEGSRLIYIVPSPAIDAILPLQAEPAPSQIARVFVGRIELVTPETKRSVEEALAKGDWPTVDRYSRFLEPILARISSESPAKAKEVEELRGNMQRYSAGQCR
jgi:hypothetical protein